MKIIYNGNIYIEKGRFEEAVCIKDNKIFKIGTSEEILKFVDDNTVLIDAKKNTVIPGFNDSHSHLYHVGVNLQNIQLNSANSIEDIINISKKFISEHNILDGEFVVGRGWNQDYFSNNNSLPTKNDLDKISTKYPILLTRACGHMAVCNSKALEICGITKNTPQIDGAEFYYDSTGEPNGIFTEDAISLITNNIPEPSIEAMAKSIELASSYALSLGITSIQTNDIRDSNYEKMLMAYDRSLNSKVIPRIYHQTWFSTLDEFYKFIDAGYYTGYGTNFNKIGPLKLFIDGSLGARTALTRNPYNDNKSTSGISCLTQEQLNAFVSLAHNNNFQVAIHGIGDKAIEMIIDSYDTVIDTKNDKRHGIIHCQITDTSLLKRILNKDILTYVQPIFINYDMHIVADRVGKTLASTSYAFGDMYRMGINVSYGTDSPVEDLNTFENLFCAVTRKDLNGLPSDGYYPEQRVSLEDAIHLYTSAGAYASFEENKKGKLLPGFLADLVILDKNIFEENIYKIRDTKVVATIINGEIAYKI